MRSFDQSKTQRRRSSPPRQRLAAGDDTLAARPRARRRDVMIAAE
jgi:hypothetical protein